ncbi:hypothetical protein H1C71_018445 [Ictidomys tridecemlineatus]|nr:hypothetical protein H1C71_018445 [Ictidomys tridecemlineatus]
MHGRVTRQGDVGVLSEAPSAGLQTGGGVGADLGTAGAHRGTVPATWDPGPPRPLKPSLASRAGRSGAATGVLSEQSARALLCPEPSMALTYLRVLVLPTLCQALCHLLLPCPSLTLLQSHLSSAHEPDTVQPQGLCTC